MPANNSDFKGNSLQEFGIIATLDEEVNSVPKGSKVFISSEPDNKGNVPATVTSGLPQTIYVQTSKITLC